MTYHYSKLTFNSQILETSGAVVVDDLDIENHRGVSYVFSNPVEIIEALTPDCVPSAISAIDSHVSHGLYVAGYIGYDAGLVMDKRVESLHERNVPLVWLGVYERCEQFDYYELDFGMPGPSADVTNIHLNIDEDSYIQCVNKVKDYISAGDIYQVNYTCKLLFNHVGTGLSLFSRLRRAHPVCHSAYLNLGKTQIISLSPELFLRRSGGCVLTRPMKGTSMRGRWSEEDDKFAANLASDEKTIAENLMILDLMRNDIGRVSEVGGVSVPRMFHIERYPTIFQMTSDVHGKLSSDVKASDLLRATFPPGSVTGAPKIRALEIIDELEQESRGVYCGSIGVFEPSGDCLLNVAIRTIVKNGDRCEMGVGSGIVADSDAEAELRESLLKGRFLTSEPTCFQLLETLLYKSGIGYAYYNEHLERMRRSAEYFCRPFDADKALAMLDDVARDINASGNQNARVRLLADELGNVEVQWNPLEEYKSGPVSLLLSSRRIDSSNIYLYHKTTRRQAYDEDLQAARERGFFDVIYCNTRNELTEGAITNIVIRLDETWYTPPISCGLLPGVWRSGLLLSGKVRERVLTLDDLRAATSVVIGNSVRGAVVVNRIYGVGESEPIVLPTDITGVL